MKSKPVSTRRSFFRKAGATLSVPLAAAAAAGATANASEEREGLKARLVGLEDVDAIRALQQRYARHVNADAREAIAELFADPRQTPRDESVRGLSADDFGEHDVIRVAADGKTATAKLHCTVRIETPIEPACTLVDMARQQGGGVVKRLEKRVLEGTYVKHGGVWKIERLTFHPA